MLESAVGIVAKSVASFGVRYAIGSIFGKKKREPYIPAFAGIKDPISFRNALKPIPFMYKHFWYGFRGYNRNAVVNEIVNELNTWLNSPKNIVEIQKPDLAVEYVVEKLSENVIRYKYATIDDVEFFERWWDMVKNFGMPADAPLWFLRYPITQWKQKIDMYVSQIDPRLKPEYEDIGYISFERLKRFDDNVRFISAKMEQIVDEAFDIMDEAFQRVFANQPEPIKPEPAEPDLKRYPLIKKFSVTESEPQEQQEIKKPTFVKNLADIINRFFTNLVLLIKGVKK